MNTLKTKRYFTKKGIVALKADKTKHSPEIDRLLKELGNSSTQIPFYAVFSANTSTESQWKPGDNIEVETYNGMFFSSGHFLKKAFNYEEGNNKDGNVKSRSKWKSPLLWGLVASLAGLGAFIFFRRRLSRPG